MAALQEEHGARRALPGRYPSLRIAEVTEPLDDPELLSLDRSGMFGHIRNVGHGLVTAWALAGKRTPPTVDGLVHVVIAGVGGSATAGDYFAAIVARSSPIPVNVVRAYPLPSYVSAETLVVVCSYSGNTEESLAAYDDARTRGATIIAITRGGKLGERASADGYVCYPVDYDAPPRATTMYTLGPLLQIGTHFGLLGFGQKQLASAAGLHSMTAALQLAPEVPAEQNPAKQLAKALHGRVPLVVGAEHLVAAATRTKNQFAENGKTLAFTDSLPEAGHNLIVGLATGKRTSDLLSLVTLESPGLYQPRIQQGFDVLAEQFAEQCIPVHRLVAPGEAPLDDLLWATAIGDYASCYMALLNGMDPTPIPQIEAFRRRQG